ncbi:MAG: hypothetical protein HY913_22500 [Desulfomonile tiedjei]|nr:hypothetical protein [Desulfomonile tiedjei]
MNTYDVLLILGGICGIIMVLGGIILLYKGAISLKERSQAKAMTLEFRNMFKMTTQYPALGLFLIGLAFIGLALYAGSRDATFPVTIEGKVTGDSPPDIALVVIPHQNWTEFVNPKNGEFTAKMSPFATPLRIMFSSNERESCYRTIGVSDLKKGVIRFEALSLPKASPPEEAAPSR